MKLLVHNDGKKKHQSWEVWTLEMKEHVARGMGSNFDEALEDYKQKVVDHLGKVSLVANAFMGNNYEPQPVTWTGKPIEDKSIQDWIKEDEEYQIWYGHRYL